jgi:hypothetical protein
MNIYRHVIRRSGRRAADGWSNGSGAGGARSRRGLLVPVVGDEDVVTKI